MEREPLNTVYVYSKYLQKYLCVCMHREIMLLLLLILLFLFYFMPIFYVEFVFILFYFFRSFCTLRYWRMAPDNKKRTIINHDKLMWPRSNIYSRVGRKKYTAAVCETNKQIS